MHLRFAAAFAAAILFAAPAHADLLIKVDKSMQQMTVTEDGNLLYTWPVSTGRAGYNTPNGAFTPIWKDREHYSREWDDAPMPYAIFFTKLGHAIHGTYEASHLGHAVSHGCVRLSVKHAAILWDLVAKNKMANTTVALTGEIPGGNTPAIARAAPHPQPDYALQQPQQGYQAQQGYAAQQQDQDDQDGDQIASVPQRVYGRSGWAVDQYGRRYYYREQPQPYDDRRPRGFFPFGW
jgi:hypothetical protein